MASAQQRNETNANHSRRQPERFQIARLYAKYEVTAVPDVLTVELNVPGNIHKRFHVESVKRAGNDPFSSQVRDDAQNPPVVDDLDNPEYEVESIFRARTATRGRGKLRKAMVKWKGWKNLTWEPAEHVQETKALDDFESKYGSIMTNDGPPEMEIGTYVGPTENQTMQRRRSRRLAKAK
ncbi:hypothetical protein K3495_g5132 [Podosphaera aphanis]|nr:hypothetical protein K3495_g5132 [Podosphaera aphanis]